MSAICDFRGILTGSAPWNSSSRIPSSPELGISGTWEQGNTVTLETDGTFNFGTRSNKVLYVFDGTNKAGSVWGRDTSNYWNPLSTISNVITLGNIPNSIRFDFKLGNSAITELIPFDVNKTYRQSSARYYAFDIKDDNYQNESGGFNLKTDRWWPPTVVLPDIYIGYQGGDNPEELIDTSSRIAVEGISNSSGYYGAGVPAFDWAREIISFRNSSAIDEEDAELLHYRDGSLLNTSKTNFITKDATYPNGMSTKVFDQVSNGCGSGVANVYTYFGYLVIDDEPSGVFVSNLSTISGLTEYTNVLFQVPHDNWTATSINIFSMEPLIADDIYLYLKLPSGDWLSTTGLKVK